MIGINAATAVKQTLSDLGIALSLLRIEKGAYGLQDMWELAKFLFIYADKTAK